MKADNTPSPLWGGSGRGTLRAVSADKTSSFPAESCVAPTRGPHPDPPHKGEGDVWLILGGTAEAAALARRLTRERPEIDLITSLAGRLGTPPVLPGRVRVGGFGGVAGLAAFLADQQVARVIDATHPFAATISAHARQACAVAGIPLQRLERPLWPRHPGDRWHWADDMAMAARLAPRLGRRILLTVGAQNLAPFARWGGPFYVARLIEPPPRLPFRRCDIVLGRGPFAPTEERALLEHFAIDLVVTKASGGTATEAKIAAARQRGIPVLLIRRPPEKSA